MLRKMVGQNIQTKTLNSEKVERQVFEVAHLESEIAKHLCKTSQTHGRGPEASAGPFAA